MLKIKLNKKESSKLFILKKIKKKKLHIKRMVMLSIQLMNNIKILMICSFVKLIWAVSWKRTRYDLNLEFLQFFYLYFNCFFPLLFRLKKKNTKKNKSLLHWSITLIKMLEYWKFKRLLRTNSFLWIVDQHFLYQINKFLRSIRVDFKYSLLDSWWLYFLNLFFLYFHRFHIL